MGRLKQLLGLGEPENRAEQEILRAQSRARIARIREDDNRREENKASRNGAWESGMNLEEPEGESE